MTEPFPPLTKDEGLSLQHLIHGRPVGKIKTVSAALGPDAIGYGLYRFNKRVSGFRCRAFKAGPHHGCPAGKAGCGIQQGGSRKIATFPPYGRFPEHPGPLRCREGTIQKVEGCCGGVNPEGLTGGGVEDPNGDVTVDDPSVNPGGVGDHKKEGFFIPLGHVAEQGGHLVQGGGSDFEVVFLSREGEIQGVATFDRHIYKARHAIENLFAKLKQYRSLVTRYDKTMRNYSAMVAIACVLTWLRL